MKKIIPTMMCLGAVIIALTACSDDTETKVLAVPTVTLSPSSVTLSSEAVESYTINYTVSNPGDGASVSASADVSWISGVDASVSGQIRFSVAANSSDGMRTGTVTLTYSYDGGAVTAKAAVVQYGAGDPVLTVDPNAVVASSDGGTYSFGYSIENPLDGEGVSCTADAGWVSGFDYSEYGKVSFTVEASEEEGLRTATITVSYASLTKEVTVVQDHPGSGDDSGSGGSGDIEGTYTITGVCYESYPYSTSWTVTIHYEPNSQYTDSEYPYLIDGLIYSEVGDYGTYSAYCAKARVEGSSIVVPAQITEGFYWLDEDYTTGAYLGYVAGYIDGDGYLNAYDSRPDMVFTYNEASGSWSCNYGIMGFLYDTPGDFGSESGYFIDFTVGDVTLTKSGSGGGGGGATGEMVGTYTAHALVNGQGYSYQEADWTVKIYPYEGSLASGSYDYWMDGVIPWGEGAYAQYGDHRASAGIRVSGTTITLPTQFANATLSSTSGGSYYLMYTPCTKYDADDGSVYYSSQWPDLTFTYNSTTGVWTSDYGVFMAGASNKNGFDSMATYFQVVTPVITLTKTSDTTSLSAGTGSRPATSFKNLVPNFSFKDAPVPSSGRGIKSRKASLRATK